MPRIPPPPFAGGVETAKEEVLVRIPKRALQISEDKKCVSSFLRFLSLAEEESDDNWSEDEIRISPLNHRKKKGGGRKAREENCGKIYFTRFFCVFFTPKERRLPLH